MLTELSSFLNRQTDKDLLGCSVIVTDKGANGEFLIHHFVAQALRDGHVTILVAFAQAFTHYSAVGTKLGVNLSRQKDSGQLVFVDCLSTLIAPLGGGTTAEGKDQSRLTFSLDSSLSLCGLYQLLRQCLCDIRQQKPDKPVCLVLDDLSVLVSVGVSLVEIVGLVHYCRQMITSMDHSPSGYMVTMVHCEEGGCEEDTLAHHILHSSHLSLNVEGLASGYSRDVHGQVTAVWRNHSPRTQKQVQFKLSDRNVHLFAKGTSSAVL